MLLIIYYCIYKSGSWTTTPSELQLAFAYASHTPVITVGRNVMALPPMVSAADGTKADTISMLLSMTLSTGQWLLPTCRPDWSQLTLSAQMVNTPIESHRYPGGVAGSWFGMLPAPCAPTKGTCEAGAVAALAKRSKHEKYLDLNQCHTFTPVAIKMAGHFEPETFSFLRELGCRLKQVTGEAKSFSYLQHHLSIAVQRENAPAVTGFMGGTISPFEYLVFFLGGTCPPSSDWLLYYHSTHDKSGSMFS